MRLHLTMLLGAIGLSCVAAYYSIIGMTSIFTGQFIPIIIMTGLLETNKLILASWLYNNWSVTRRELKIYYICAIVVLMLITSMGIFGFLSKTSVMQASLAEEQHAQIHQVEQKIEEQNELISQAKHRIASLGTDSTVGDIAINARITDANKVIELANARIQPQIDAQQHIIDQERDKIDQRIKLMQSQVEDLGRQITSIDGTINSISTRGKSKQAQQAQYRLVQLRSDRSRLLGQKLQILKQIDTIHAEPDDIIDTANAEITKLHNGIEDDTKPARLAINSMAAQLGQAVDTNKVQLIADQQNDIIKKATEQIDQLTATKFKLESDTRKLDVEVGPITYIAQMIYGDDIDAKLLAHAVRWVIFMLIFVFDPLAVLMLIGANQGLAQHFKSKKTVMLHEYPTNFEKPGYTLQHKERIVNDVDRLIDHSRPDINQSGLNKSSTTIIQNETTTNELENVDSVLNNIDTKTNRTSGPISSTDDLFNFLKQEHSNRLSNLDNQGT